MKSRGRGESMTQGRRLNDRQRSPKPEVWADTERAVAVLSQVEVG